MKKVSIVLISLLIVACIIVGFTAGFSYRAATSPTKVVTKQITVKENYTVVVDDLGRIVHIPKTVDRVISLSSGIDEIIYALGCGDMLVGRDYYTSFPPQVKNVTIIYSKGGLNLELALSLNPQVVFAWWYQKYRLEQLEKYVPVVYVNPKSVNDVLKTIKLVGIILGVEDEADNLVKYMSNYISLVRNRVKNMPEENRVKVYYELGGLGKTVGYDTFTNELITMAGGYNIALKVSADRYPKLTPEYIIKENPDIIVVISWGKSMKEIVNRPGWDSINAVIDNRVYKIESGWVTCSPRLILGMLQFAKWFYPNVFQDIDIRSIEKEIYSTYYGIAS